LGAGGLNGDGMTFHDFQLALDRWLADQWVIGALLALAVVCWLVGKVVSDEPKLRKGRPPQQPPS